MTSQPKPSTDNISPPPGCGRSDVDAWRVLIAAARAVVRAPLSKTSALNKAAKGSKRAAIPIGERFIGSVFDRFHKGATHYASLHPDQKPARARELAGLAEAIAAELGDDHDAAMAAPFTHAPVRARRDIDD